MEEVYLNRTEFQARSSCRKQPSSCMGNSSRFHKQKHAVNVRWMAMLHSERALPAFTPSSSSPLPFREHTVCRWSPLQPFHRALNFTGALGAAWCPGLTALNACALRLTSQRGKLRFRHALTSSHIPESHKYANVSGRLKRQNNRTTIITLLVPPCFPRGSEAPLPPPASTESRRCSAGPARLRGTLLGPLF